MQQIEASKQAEMMGRPMLPIIVFVLYGVYLAVRGGLMPSGWPNAPVLILGGILSIVAVAAYMRSIDGRGPSWGKALAGFGGLIPYLYSLYVIGYVGIWSLVQLFTGGFSWSGLVIGLFAVVLGYRILKTFYDITELAEAAQ